MPCGAKEYVCLGVLLWIVIASSTALPASAQITFASAVALGLTNNLKIKSAEEDIKKAAAALAVTRDIFIPSVVAGGGVGTAYGITLTVPTIFTIDTQSLVYSAQQRFYIRAARSDLRSAQFAFAEARDQAEEDVAITYFSIDHAQKAMAVVTEQYNLATRLVSIVEDRVNGNLDSELELMKARRTAVQLRLQKLHAEDEIASLTEHLGQLIDRPADDLTVVPESIPALPPLNPDSSFRPEFSDSSAVLSAEQSAKAKRERAKGDSIYTWRPLVSFAAQYGRVSPIENVSEFYNIHGNYNSASIGVQIQFPLLDQVRKAAGNESTADAVRSQTELAGLRFDEDQGRKKLLRAVPELAASAELAEIEQKIAASELDSVLVEMKHSNGGPVVTPKEEMNVRIQERQRFLDLLDAKLQLAKAQISLLRQTGKLDAWIRTIPSSAQPAP